ncbi:ribosome hibernation-promoting factor, HPF/YfiA family [Balneola vulgaris]|jgi:putative sigma-54 modulation protein|uniref:ribosome hibernation-promoting factor, HPF/YfiA family n=1 Tax=Balneola vulgaris TaxID=287535 RepID=UPI00035F1265|nr:ribosome-associated translation inhibitor RaiA [Balneola vulgaris]
MNISITSRHFDASENLKEFSIGSVEKLEQFYDRIVSCDIILEPTSDPKHPQKAEIIIKVPRKVIAVNEKAETYEKAISDAVDVATRQIKRYKEKLHAVH